VQLSPSAGNVRQPRDVCCRHTCRTTCRQQRTFSRRSTGRYVFRDGLFCDIQRCGSSHTSLIILSIRLAYDGGPGSISIPWLCLFAFLTGVGGCAAFAGSIKTCETPCTLEKNTISS